jgi:hypothetical protein
MGEAEPEGSRKIAACSPDAAQRVALGSGALQSWGRTKVGVRYDSGSAEWHEECRTASGKRGLSYRFRSGPQTTPFLTSASISALE